jgi:hypothetical protein
VDAIAEVKGCAKSGKAPVTAQKLFETQVAPSMSQEDVKMLVFSE